MSFVPDHIRSGPNASMPAGTDGYPMWAYDTLTLYIWQGGTKRAQASQAWVSSLYAPLVSPSFTGPVTINESTTYGTAETPVATGVTLSHSSSDASHHYNLGAQITPNVDGQITHLGAKLGATGTYTVRLFDSGGTELGSVTVNAVVGTMVYTALAAPISVTEGNWYSATVYVGGAGQSWYDNNGADSLPLTTKNITINQGCYKMDATTAPDVFDSYVRSVDVKFTPVKPPLKTAVYPNYASNAAAIAAGLVAGEHYRQGDFVCQVH
jgi:hypothetical protein